MDNQELCDKMQQSILFLFLGQEFGASSNNILFDILEKKLNIETQKNRYDIFLQLVNEVQLEWIQGQCNYLMPPTEYEILAKIPWNSVITSSVIDNISRSFENEWRKVYPVSVAGTMRKSITDKKRLVASFLYGNIFDDSEISRPPINKLDFLKHKSEASKLLSMYSKEVLSPYGLVFIEGYNPDNDWVKIDELIQVFANYGIGQVHYFGGSLKSKSEDWSILCDMGIVQEHAESLVDFFCESQECGYIDLDNLELTESEDKLISINGKSVKIPFDKYNEFKENAIIVDDSVLLLSENQIRKDFIEYKHFLYESGNSPVWLGYKNNFDFSRTVMSEINNCISNELKAEIGVKPIIIHGQAGSGKTVILGRLAYTYKIARNYPVVYIPSYYKTPSAFLISKICKWMDENGARKTLIFWDGNFYNDEINQYCELSQKLISSGRNVVLIGTSHKLSTKQLNKYNVHNFVVKNKLDSNEVEDLSLKFKQYTGINLPLDKIQEWNEESVVVALYRMLPATRNNIRKGIVSEATQNMEQLKNVLSIKENTKNTPFEKLFLNAGLICMHDNQTITENYHFEEMLNYVCVPAQFGLYVPFSFVLGCINYQLNTEIVDIIDKMDFFRIILTEEGDFLIYVRNSLEAQIVVRNKICCVEEEVRIIEKYIDYLSYDNGELQSKKNIEFVIAMLKAIGPNGLNSEKYEDYFLDISTKLKEIREKGVEHPRLILQEVSFSREYAKKANIDANERVNIFKESQKLLIYTNQYLKEQKNSERLRGWILSELAANYATLLQVMHDGKKASYKEMHMVYTSMIDAIRSARGVLVDSFHALDVCAWGSLILLRDKMIDKQSKAEVYTNALAIYEQAGVVSPEMLELGEYNSRLLSLSDAVGDLEVSEEVFEHLLRIGSANGIYLRSKEQIKNINFMKPLSSQDICICKKTLKYMQSFSGEDDITVSEDLNCLYLKFKLIWAIKAKEPLFYREKRALGFNQKDWEELLDIINSILIRTPEYVNANLKYLRFIALFHLNRKEEWKKCINEIQHIDYPYDKRIINNYIASNETGHPRIYSGEIVEPIGDNKIMLYISEIKMSIPCFLHGFVLQTHALGEKFRHIEIGFNFLGVQVCKIHDLQEEE